LPDELQKKLFKFSLTKRHEIFAETRVNEEGPSMAVIRPLKKTSGLSLGAVKPKQDRRGGQHLMLLLLPSLLPHDTIPVMLAQ
jgi:hypothetical protein